LRENYLKYEEGYIKKKWTGRLPIALVFPEKYEIAMSNLGFLSLYESLNRFEEIVAERFFFEEEIRSLESNRPLKDFPLILYSIPFEGSYIRALQILIKSGISLDPQERKETVLGGGVALWANPEPLAPFFDGFILGEWEALEEKITPLFIEYGYNKKKLLFELNKFDFFYSPLHFGRKRVRILKILPPERPLLSKLLSEKAEFGKSYLLEVSKGCGRACRFCLAGFIYRPPRVYPLEKLLERVEEIPENSKVGLIGLDFVDKEEILLIGKKLLEKKVTLTFSSIRLDALREEFLKLLATTRSIAIAPETASIKLKRIINKEIPEEEIFNTLERLKKTPIKKVKFYFMLGLPFEEENDIIATAQFVGELLKRKYPFNFTFSFSFFVPKPHTPFQWADFEDLTTLEKKKKLLLKILPFVKGVKIESLRECFLQALLARGDIALKDFLLSLAMGKSLKMALREMKNLENYLKPRKDKDYPFPWDFIDTGVSKDFLFREWERALRGEISPCCRVGKCKACSACKGLKLFSS
jgi:radical SAM superfamily enzyme YgiQ (UPF0313 family)